MALETNNDQIHFVLFPFMAQGHMIPMMDIAKLLAQRGLIITIVTTHGNAARFAKSLDRAVRSGLQIQILKLTFPWEQVGLPKGCDNLDMLPNYDKAHRIFTGAALLQEPAEEALEAMSPRPSCIISDMCLPWTLDIANKLCIPRITFSGFGSFYLFCIVKVVSSGVLDAVESDTQVFVVPGLSDRVEFTKDQLSLCPQTDGLTKFFERVGPAEKASFGVVVNSFEELEPSYAEEYKKSRKGRAWCIGPVSLCNDNQLDKTQRGNKYDLNEHTSLKWLNKWPEGSVVYVCMGSLCNIIPSQLVELGLGLEASGKPFIWAIRGWNQIEAVEKWIKDDGFEERVHERGMLIRGWAPQLLILSHPSIGGFLTHCGWNSTLEGICAGLPLITWPLFGDQFGNQKLVEQVLKISVGVGVAAPTKWGQEEKIGVLVKRACVERAIMQVMDVGEKGKERRKKARELSEIAKSAMKVRGSSYNNISMLIKDVMQFHASRLITEK